MLIANLSRTLRRGVLRTTVSCASILVLHFSGLAYAGPAEDTKEAKKLFEAGKFDQALAKVTAALALQPKDLEGRFLKGMILIDLKKTTDAIQVFTSLTQDYPEQPEPYNNLAALYSAQGNYEKAKAALELAIYTHPTYATAYENLGDIYAQMAWRSYDKVLQLDKNNLDAPRKLSMVRAIVTLPRIGNDPTQVAMAPKGETKANSKVEPGKSAATPAVKPANNAAKGEVSDEVKTTVLAWAGAWAAKDTAAYLGFYAPDFETPKGMTRAAWEAQRKARIEPKKSITVDVKILKTTLQGNVATVVFHQSYRADAIKSDNTKTMVMAKTGDRWLIRSARDGG